MAKDRKMICFWTAVEFLKTREEFTMEELEDEVIRRGGIFRIAPNYPLRDFINEYVADGWLKFDYSSGKYINLRLKKNK